MIELTVQIELHRHTEQAEKIMRAAFHDAMSRMWRYDHQGPRQIKEVSYSQTKHDELFRRIDRADGIHVYDSDQVEVDRLVCENE